MGRNDKVSWPAHVIRCAVGPWWWTLVACLAFYLFAWLVMVVLFQTNVIDDLRPLWGGASLELIHTVWLFMIALLKVFLLTGAAFGLFLHKWANALQEVSESLGAES